MSTVVYRDGVLVGDRQITEGNMQIGQVRKVYQTGKYLIGFAGSYSDAMAFMRWAETDFRKSAKPDTVRDVEAIVVKKDGTFYSCAAPLWEPEPIHTPFYALGSGSSLAYGALEMGASAERAVEVACKYDIYSGNGIDVLTLDDIPSVKKRTRGTTRKRR